MLNQSQENYLQLQGNLTERLGLSDAPVPLEPYHSEDFFQLEKKQIFERAWLLVCREEELPNPGSFIVKRIFPTDVSALITRSSAGKIQAFYNTCSHRGAQLEVQQSGQKGRFTCIYHRWTYQNDGKLIGVPDEANFFNLEKEKCGLTKINTQVWNGWVFLNLAENPEVTLEEYLGDFKSYFEGVEYIGADNPVVFEMDLDVNWKVLADAFIESYHIFAIHPETLTPSLTSKSNPYGRLLDAQAFGPHRGVSVYGNPENSASAKSPVELLANKLLGDGRQASMWGQHKAGKGESSDDAQDSQHLHGVSLLQKYLSHPAINPTNSDCWGQDIYHLFPHVQIDTGPNGFWCHKFWPMERNKTRYEGRFYMTKAQNFSERFMQEMYIARLAPLIAEDIASMRRTQIGIESGGKKFMILQDSEVAIRHHIEVCTRWVKSKTVKEALA